MSDLKKYCMFLYAIYISSAIMQLFEETALAGGLIVIVAYFMTTSKEKKAKDTPFASHLQWLIRTFWIGTGVLGPLAIILATIFIMSLTDISSVADTMNNNEDPSAILEGVQGYIQDNMAKMSRITLISMSPVIIWWLRRCYAGAILVKAEKPVENVKSWL